MRVVLQNSFEESKMFWLNCRCGEVNRTHPFIPPRNLFCVHGKKKNIVIISSILYSSRYRHITSLTCIDNTYQKSGHICRRRVSKPAAIPDRGKGWPDQTDRSDLLLTFTRKRGELCLYICSTDRTTVGLS